MRQHMARLQDIFAAILRERDYQDAKWGTIEEHGHEVGGWLTILPAYRVPILETQAACFSWR